MFHTDGLLIPKSKCDYKFYSLYNDTYGGPINYSKGRFFSLQYPSTYPKNIMCTYHFIGQPNEKVRIVFELVRLHKSDLR